MRCIILTLTISLIGLSTAFATSHIHGRTATPPPLFEFSLPFPTELHCDEISFPYLGPSWNGIQVGVSTVDELDRFVSGFGVDYSIGTFPDSNFRTYTNSLSIREADELGLPNVINICFELQTETITAIQPAESINDMRLTDLIIEYGEPDVVTWTYGSTELRVALWFEYGIAATIYVNLVDRFEPFGTILSITYFPFQPVEGFETRWPFNRTVSGDLLEQLERRATLTPEVPNVANPFDFDAMIATITAQPTRTPTPTFTPRTPAPTRTRTPTPVTQTAMP